MDERLSLRDPPTEARRFVYFLDFVLSDPTEIKRASTGGWDAFCYAAPIGAFFCPEIRAFTGFWDEISSTASKVLSDRKVLFKHKNGR